MKDDTLQARFRSGMNTRILSSRKSQISPQDLALHKKARRSAVEGSAVAVVLAFTQQIHRDQGVPQSLPLAKPKGLAFETWDSPNPSSIPSSRTKRSHSSRSLSHSANEIRGI